MLEQVALTYLIRPYTVPHRPAERKLLVHQAFEALSAECFDPLCLLCLELLLCQPLELCRLAFARQHGCARGGEFVAKLNKLRFKFCRLVALRRVPLLHRHRAEHLNLVSPVFNPVSVGLNEPRLRQACARLLEQVLLAPFL